MPEIYLNFFENTIIPFCMFKRNLRETETVKLNVSSQLVEQPDDELITNKDEITKEKKDTYVEGIY
jgi:hypothetical protein